MKMMKDKKPKCQVLKIGKVSIKTRGLDGFDNEHTAGGWRPRRMV